MELTKKALGFRALRQCGAGVMHTLVVGICLVLTLCNIYGAHFQAARYFHPILKWPLLALYYYGVANYLLAYAQAVFTPTARPPKNPEDSLSSRCAKCNLVKPPRAHHCSVCGVCSLRFDHHCPWIAGDVNLNNTGYFIKFLCWGLVASTYSLLLELGALFAGKFCKGCDLGTKIISNLIVFLFTACSIACCAMMAFTQLPMLKRNETSPESYDNEYEIRQAKKQGLTFQYPYDRGLRKNLEEVFGPQLLAAWLIPGYRIRPIVDGMSFTSQKGSKL